MPPNPTGRRTLLLLTRPRLMVVSGRGGARSSRPSLLLVTAVLALGLISGASAMWGTSGKAAPKLKKSDADMKNTIMKGSKDLYDDPTKPPEWLLADKMVEPGLPTTPPPPAHCDYQHLVGCHPAAVAAAAAADCLLSPSHLPDAAAYCRCPCSCLVLGPHNL